MADPSYSTRDDFAAGLERLLTAVEAYYPDFTMIDRDRLTRAYWFGYGAHKDQKRKSGEPYYMHPVEASMILLQIKPDLDTLIACLLHDVIEDTPTTADEIEREFGPGVRFICEGVEKVAKVRAPKGTLQKGNLSAKYATYQKLFLAVASDIRVIFVKLADRVHNLRTLGHVDEEKRLRICTESQEIYAPVALQLGLYRFRGEIEDLCLRWLHPEDYALLQRDLKRLSPDMERFMEQAKRDILPALHTAGIPLQELKYRVKDLSSIWEKMQRKHISHVHEVYDVVAMRIIVSTEEECYRTLGVLHRHWNPMPGRFKDYIAVPKPNGYQSLHTTLLGLGDRTMPTEVQIRTRQMDMDAEFGPADHWLYKQAGKADQSTLDSSYRGRMQWLAESVQEGTPTKPTAEHFFDHLQRDILRGRIYAFTPRGDIHSLPEGATPVDFAYRIHSTVGDSCIGAKVNGNIKPLPYRIQSGDVIEILTQKGRSPNPAWLDFVVTSQARQRISAAVRKAREAENNDAPAPEHPPTTAVSKPKPSPRKPPVSDESTPGATPHIMIGGMPDIPWQYAQCCTPRVSGQIIAYKTRGLQYTVHSSQCEELETLDPARLMEAHYYLRRDLWVTGSGRLMPLIDTIVSQCGAEIIGYQKHHDPAGQRYHLTLEVSSESELEDIITHLEHTQAIRHVQRSLSNTTTHS